MAAVVATRTETELTTVATIVQAYRTQIKMTPTATGPAIVVIRVRSIRMMIRTATVCATPPIGVPAEMTVSMTT